jgi:hypothetical protein
LSYQFNFNSAQLVRLISFKVHHLTPPAPVLRSNSSLRKMPEMVKCLWEVPWIAAALLPLFSFRPQCQWQAHLHRIRLWHAMNAGRALSDSSLSIERAQLSKRSAGRSPKSFRFQRKSNNQERRKLCPRIRKHSDPRPPSCLPSSPLE